MLCASASPNLCPNVLSSDFSCSDFSAWPMTSPSMLSWYPAASVGAKLATLAVSSASLILRETKFACTKLCGFATVEVGDMSFASVANACVFATDSCVVALERSWGLAGAVEWDVEGRDSRPRAGRGGSGGGVSSRDTKELIDGWRENLRIIPRVGFAKSVCSIGSPLFDLAEALLLCWVGVGGELPASEAGDWASAFPVSSIKIAVAVHLDGSVLFLF